MTTTTTTNPSKQRKQKAAKLSPQAAHELDILRADRQGIDISGMAPGERCKYPSKFCCFKRARKSTGQLHRFCDLHRTRASANQKRWMQTRRCQERNLGRAETCRLVCQANEQAMGSRTTPADTTLNSNVTQSLYASGAPPVEVVHDSFAAITDDEVAMLVSILAPRGSSAEAAYNSEQGGGAKAPLLQQQDPAFPMTKPYGLDEDESVVYSL